MKKWIFITFTTAAVYLPAVILDGLVLSFLWKWHVAPVFGFRLLTMLEAAGLVMPVVWLTHQTSYDDISDDRSGADIFNKTWHVLIGTLVVFVSGYLLHLIKTW